MAQEIERKFLVDFNKLPPLPAGEAIKQAYIDTNSHTVVRVRLIGDEAFLTLKGANRGNVRSEFEYSVPVDDAKAIVAELCDGPSVEKTRYLLPHAGHIWELDIFEGDNQGLVVAEVEMATEHEAVQLPSWVTQEVSGQPRYYNVSLLKKPYCQW